jgi:DNA-directed RNA polymerase III subunit RPC3
VAEALATRGRLSFRDLVFFTKLKPRIIRGAVLVLVQHNLLWHSISDGDEVFELVTEDCFMRLRFGKYVQIVQDLLGDEVGVPPVLKSRDRNDASE